MKLEITYRKLLHALTIQEQRFVCEYLIHGNATKAARKADYGAAEGISMRRLAWETLHRLDVQEAIHAGLASMAERCEVDADRVTRELAAVAFSNISHYEIDKEGEVALTEDAPAEAIRAVASIRRKKRTRNFDNGESKTTYETEYKLWDKIAALTLLGRKLKLFVDKIEVDDPQSAVYRALLQQLKEQQGK